MREIPLVSTQLAVAPKKAFEMLDVGVTKGYQLIRDRELEAFKIGRATRITVASIEALIERRLNDRREAA